jgi:hypothetical protein
MAGMLSICTKKEQRPVVHFLWAQGAKGVKIHRYFIFSVWEEEDCHRVFCCMTSLLHHSAAHIKETLQKLKSEALDHPPYSSDLAPSDFHLFGHLKEALRGCQ